MEGFKPRKYLNSKQAEKYIQEQAEGALKSGRYVPPQHRRVRAKFPNERLWTGERKAKIIKAVAQYNSTVARLDKRYAGMVQLPDRVNINDEISRIRTTKEFNARVHQLEMILKKNSKTAQQIVTRFNSETGEVVYRLRYLDRELKAAKKKLDRRYEGIQSPENDRRPSGGDSTESEEYTSAAPWRGTGGSPEGNASEESPRWDDINTDDMDGEDLTDMLDQLSEKASDYADLYLDTWDAYAGDYDGHDNVSQIIDEFKKKNPKALEAIFMRGPNGTIPPEAQIEYLYPGAKQGGVGGAGKRSGKTFHKESFSRDTEEHSSRLFKVEMFWEEMAAEYGIR